MAADQRFESFNSSLSDLERDQIRDLIKNKRNELMAARSEDARVRLIHEYILEVREMLGQER